MRPSTPTTPFGTPILQAIAASREASAPHQLPPEPPCTLQVGDQVVVPQQVLATIGHRSDAWHRQNRPGPPVAVPTGNIGTVWAISPERRCATVVLEVSFPDAIQGHGPGSGSLSADGRDSHRDDEPRTVSVDVRLDRLELVKSPLPAPD